MSDHMTQSLADFQAAILADGIIDEAEVNQIRERVYADGIIDREEADFLFALNDAASDQDNHASWTTLFVDAICDHVLKDETSPGTVDDDEAAYLISKIQADGTVDSTELTLLVELCNRATGEAPASLNAFILANVKDAVLDDGIIDAAEVELLSKVIYGAGGSSGAYVDRAEADLLFDLNDATTGKANDASWKDLFVAAITSHVLGDDASPDAVDADEAAWLIARIEGDDVYDDNEKALLRNIKAKAASLDGKLAFKIGMFT